MGDKARKGNRLTHDQHGGRIKRPSAKGPPTHPDDLRPEQTPRGRGREIKVSNKQPGLPRHKFQSGGRTRLLEELGRVEAEPSNRNRRAEISRVHGELNKGYKTGGRVGLKKGGSDKKWIQKAVNPKHKGYCTPMTKKTCTPARKALARTFKKKAKTGW